MSEIRLAIAGVGNCASAIVQGMFHYDSHPPDDLMHESIGGYRVNDITPVCGFDVDDRKVGRDLADAIFAAPNCATQFAEVPDTIGAPVYRGPVLDGVDAHTNDPDDETKFSVDEGEPVDVAAKLRAHDADVLVCYLPVGSTEAVEHYAEACLEAGVALVNAIPVFIASDDDWGRRFASRGIPVVGDDIKSQLGATITHRALVELFQSRGVAISDTYQLNVGGNTDFLNMLDRSRLASKKTSKTDAVNDLLDEPLDDSHIHIGPSDYVEWLDDRKTAFVRVEGRKFGGVPVEVDLQLRVEDSPNSAGSAVDAIRCAKVGLDRGVGGPLVGPSAVTMKRPPEQLGDAEATDRFEAFVHDDRPS